MKHLLGLVAVGGAGIFGTTMLHYGYQLMTELALWPVMLIGVWIFLNIMLILKCGRSSNGGIKLFGDVWGEVFKYTALAQAVLYTVLVIWPIAVMFGWDDFPADKQEFLTDFSIGAGYLSMFIFGGAGGSAAMTATQSSTRWLSILFALVTIALPLLVLFVFEQQLQMLIASRELLFTLTVVAYLLLTSLVGMWLVLKSGAEIAANPKRHSRLP